MSCRIERVVSGENCVVFCVSGRIQAEHVEMLRHLLGREKGKVAIDLKDVLLVTREAVKLLDFSEAGGIELRNCPSYVREWVARERTHTDVDPVDLRIGASEDIEDV